MTKHLDAERARRWFTAALGALAAARPSLDALNLFPVPDADTGSNVVRTLAAGARSAQELPANATLAELAAALAEGSLWGARGNSGVILAQSLQAIAQTFTGLEAADGDDLIRAFDALASAANGAVAQPVEGTIITVAREVAAATLALPTGVLIEDVLATALHSAYAATEATTEQLPVLRGTGKVDAGAVCLVIVLEELAREFGVPLTAHPHWFPDPDSGPQACEIPGFEVMYLLRATPAEAALLQRRLTEIGEAVVVVRGGGDLWHVHVHLDHPQEALAAGEMSQVVVRKLDMQGHTFGVVAATTAPGLLEPLAEAGAVAVLRARERTLARAIIDTGARHVIVVPCSGESLAEARAASRHETVLAEDVQVTIADTVSNLAALDVTLGLAQRRVDAGRNTTVEKGEDVAEILGAVERGAREYALPLDVGEVGLQRAAEELVRGGIELVTVLAGAGPRAQELAGRLVDLIRALAPDVEAYILDGAQEGAALEVSAL